MYPTLFERARAMFPFLLAPTPPIPNVPTSTSMLSYIGFSTCMTHTLVLSAIFSAMLLASPYLLRPLLGDKLYDSFSPKTRGTLRAYVVALTHHFIVTPAAIYALYRMATPPPTSTPHSPPLDVDFALLSLLPPVTFSYLLTDLVFFVVPNRDVEFLVHHGVTGLISYNLLVAPAHASCRWTAFLYCMELSSVPFAASFVARKTGHGEGRVALVAQALFFVSFLATRIVLFPAAILALILVHPSELGGVINALLVALALLQVYWLVPICKQACTLIGGRRGGGGAAAAAVTTAVAVEKGGREEAVGGAAALPRNSRVVHANTRAASAAASTTSKRD